MTEREKIVRWVDSTESFDEIGELSGLDYLRRISAGELPDSSMAAHAEMRLVSVEEGAVELECRPDDSHYNRMRTIHGGLMCTLLDSALGSAVSTTLPAGQGLTSIEINVNYMRAVFPENAPLRCAARVIKPGRRVAFAEGDVFDAGGKKVANATSTFLVFPLEERPRRRPGTD